jgi:hypothetical protein
MDDRDTIQLIKRKNFSVTRLSSAVIMGRSYSLCRNCLYFIFFCQLQSLHTNDELASCKEKATALKASRWTTYGQLIVTQMPAFQLLAGTSAMLTVLLHTYGYEL